jgi:hypothetical protein
MVRDDGAHGGLSNIHLEVHKGNERVVILAMSIELWSV